MCDSEICSKAFEKYRITVGIREEEKKNILKLLFNMRKDLILLKSFLQKCNYIQK